MPNAEVPNVERLAVKRGSEGKGKGRFGRAVRLKVEVKLRPFGISKIRVGSGMTSRSQIGNVQQKLAHRTGVCSMPSLVAVGNKESEALAETWMPLTQRPHVPGHLKFKSPANSLRLILLFSSLYSLSGGHCASPLDSSESHHHLSRSTCQTPYDVDASRQAWRWRNAPNSHPISVAG